jgi:NAD(P)-dependent dehydrogenase (short-subunit alcohol dehydrogenase family)
MKVFVTGHTSGIGLATYNLLKKKGYEVSGGSRSTGFDISNESLYHEIYKYDVFINNAYHKTGQLKILESVYSQWRNKEKTIINVGSAGKDLQRNRPYERLDYNVLKKSLETYSFWISENDEKCRAMMYNPGFVDTPLARTGFKQWPLSEQKRVLSQAMEPEECAKTILFMIESKHKIKELTHTH